jgi:[protein-PII] uridylyltransferase
MRAAFSLELSTPDAGWLAVHARAEAVDSLLAAAFDMAVDDSSPAGFALLAVGGYGRRELFPYSDIDLLFLLEGKTQERESKNLVRRINQTLWDCGLRVSPMTRTLAECDRFDPHNVEFTLALLDARPLAGGEALAARLVDASVPKLMQRERRRIVSRCVEVTKTRYAKYGNTLFHLEPNVKECPGGLRDVHVCDWLDRLCADPTASASQGTPAGSSVEFAQAHAFLQGVRVFLHLRHGRDDNTLEWESQDAAAAGPLGSPGEGLPPAYWMRLYFRHARSIERRTAQAVEAAMRVGAASRLSALRLPRRITEETLERGFEQRDGILRLCERGEVRPAAASDSTVVLPLFAAMAATGARLERASEASLSDALPMLAASLEDGAALWGRLRPILQGSYAGRALRAMHAVGILELLFPQFHGIDALVIRDAYHRYTVDEHTFVVIDTLHTLRSTAATAATSGVAVWAGKFAGLLRDLPHPELLFLAALLHDTGKARAGTGHAAESARMAETALRGLELDAFETAQVLDLIRNHLEMSAALRRDVFDRETIRSFAARVPTREALRMLTLFTYADIAAVHPDALTPWKTENLWRLYSATSEFLDRSVDEERVAPRGNSGPGGMLDRVTAELDRVAATSTNGDVERFLNGWPRRYLETRTTDEVREHFRLAVALDEGALDQLSFRYGESLSELTLVTRDRPMLFAAMAGVLAAWAMNIVTADAFSNASGIVVDTFRFTDTFRTLELNESERARFLGSVRSVLSGERGLDEALASRRRSQRREPKVQVEPRVEFDDTASSHSTLVQVVAQDSAGLLHVLALALAEQQCSIEVALIDTEGERAIDVFYLTEAGARLGDARKNTLRQALLDAVAQNEK